MRYLAVEWIHSHADEPILLYSELNKDGWEIRKVEIYRNGTADYADAAHHTGNTELGLMPVPALEEIAADPQFKPREISIDDFEKVWRQFARREELQAA